MKHNIIQMTATAGLTVTHSINQIFQYIFDCLGKRSIRSISRYGQWRALPCHAQRIFVSKNWRGWHGRHLVSTGRGHTAVAVIWMMCFILKWKGSIFLIKTYFWKNIHVFFYSRFKFQMLDGPPCICILQTLNFKLQGHCV